MICLTVANPDGQHPLPSIVAANRLGKQSCRAQIIVTSTMSDHVWGAQAKPKNPLSLVMDVAMPCENTIRLRVFMTAPGDDT